MNRCFAGRGRKPSPVHTANLRFIRGGFRLLMESGFGRQELQDKAPDHDQARSESQGEPRRPFHMSIAHTVQRLDLLERFATISCRFPD